MLKYCVKFFTVIIITITLTACGGGGGGGGAAQTTSAAKTFNVSGAVGEVFSMTIDTTKKIFSHTTLKSDYGCDVSTSPCYTGSGALTLNTDGTYSSATSNSIGPDLNLSIKPDGLIAGTIQWNAPSFGAPVYIPIIGVTNPIVDSSKLAGTYNAVKLVCTTPSYGSITTTNCKTTYGTYVFTPGANSSTVTFQSCNQVDVTSTPSCTGTGSTTLTVNNSGYWVDATNTRYFSAYTSSSGQNIGFIDFGSPTMGYGQTVLMSQSTINPSSVYGSYFLATIGVPFSATWTINSSGYSYTTSAGFTSAVSPVTYNSPWAGFISFPLGPALISSDGLFVIAGGSAQFEFGY